MTCESNPSDIFTRYVESLVTLGQCPGSFDYAKERALELEADQSGLFRGIYQTVNLRLKAGQALPTASDSQIPEKSA